MKQKHVNKIPNLTCNSIGDVKATNEMRNPEDTTNANTDRDLPMSLIDSADMK